MDVLLVSGFVVYLYLFPLGLNYQPLRAKLSLNKLEALYF